MPHITDAELRGMDAAALRALNRRVVEALRGAQALDARSKLAELAIGDRVTFVGRRGVRLAGAVTAINRTTATVTVDGGECWRVAPALFIRTR